tara:strand:- start:170 stop:361 length:192 start_codon:yes stop_codon:yes gene_type:complete
VGVGSNYQVLDPLLAGQSLALSSAFRGHASWAWEESWLETCASTDPGDQQQDVYPSCSFRIED